MPEFRKDPLTGHWNILAPERSRRGNDYLDAGSGPRPCPFCPGHEQDTPDAVLTVPADSPGNWQIRVIPNKFPAAVSDPGTLPSTACSTQPGYGVHEVIIEAREHDLSFADFSIARLTDVLTVYQERIRILKQNRQLKYSFIFKNHGERAGASRIHPHSQLVALPLLPKKVEDELKAAQAHYVRSGTCFYCQAMMAAKAGQRSILGTERMQAFCPCAPRFPYETWILPVRHEARFEEASAAEIEALAQALQSTLRAVVSAAGAPAYNLALHTAPLEMGPLPFDHWRLEIIPRRSTLAGFELGTGVYVHEVTPEQAALTLRHTPASGKQI